MARSDAERAYAVLAALGQDGVDTVLPLYPMDVTDPPQLVRIAMASGQHAMAGPATLDPRPYPAPPGFPPLEGYIKLDVFHDIFAADLPRKQARIMSLSQRPAALATLGEPLRPARLGSHPVVVSRAHPRPRHRHRRAARHGRAHPPTQDRPGHGRLTPSGNAPARGSQMGACRQPFERH
jgi:hypothetical protein